MTKSILLGLSLVALSTAAAAQPFPMNERAGVRWACAGIGEEEREAFAKLEPQSNLKLVFAAGKRGAYLADVYVSLVDLAGKQPALEFTAQGPICLIQAPAGRYQLEATYGEAKRSVSATIAKEAKQPGMVLFRFPGED